MKIIKWIICAAAITQGCSSYEVAPSLAANPNVRTIIGGQGYPVLDQIQFRSTIASTPSQASICAKLSVDMADSTPTIMGKNVQTSGISSFEPPPPSIGKPFRFTLLITSGEFTVLTFDRISYKDAGPIGAISGIGAENAYAAMQGVANRVEQCLSSAS